MNFINVVYFNYSHIDRYIQIKLMKNIFVVEVIQIFIE